MSFRLSLNMMNVIFLYNKNIYPVNCYIILVKFCVLEPYLNDFLDQFSFWFCFRNFSYIGWDEYHV